MTLGAHTLHFGATFTREQTNDFWLQYSGGDWIFDNLQGIYGAGGLGGSMYGSDLFGLNLVGPGYSYPAPNGKNYPLNAERGWRQNLLEPYIQDDWKISKRLTVNLGVRYEWASNPTTSNGSIFVLPAADETNVGKTSMLSPTLDGGQLCPRDQRVQQQSQRQGHRSAHRTGLRPVRGSQDLHPRRLRHVSRAGHLAHLRVHGAEPDGTARRRLSLQRIFRSWTRASARPRAASFGFTACSPL